MSDRSLSPDAQAILLLTAPLLAGRGRPSPDLLTPGEYNRLARLLREREQQPADLLGPEAHEVLAACQPTMDGARLERLLGRGFVLSQAVEHWQARAIWVVSRADAGYPRRLKERLKEHAPAVLYACGDEAILETGGLAVVGSRHVDDGLVAQTERIGELAAAARCTLVSGGARGIDQAAMRGALEAGGKVVGILADSLERAAMVRDHRAPLMDDRLVLLSPYDPAAPFNVGHAMQRNKLIYALADAALVVSADYQRGGTWAGAVEQLEKWRLVPVYVRSSGEPGRGLEGLRDKGALRWPDPVTPEAFLEALRAPAPVDLGGESQESLPLPGLRQPQPPTAADPPSHRTSVPASASTPAEELFAKIRDLLAGMEAPKTDSEVAAELQVSRSQAQKWLHRLVEEGVLEKTTRPVRYRPASPTRSLFDQRA
jgi:DNA processing protein